MSGKLDEPERATEACEKCLHDAKPIPKKQENLKELLESPKDAAKLEAMKRIVVTIAKGRDASKLFPSVVKNVVSKNPELRKLVYVYIVRYAENQELVLLSVSTLQRGLKEPNPLLRANALKVLSSIKVKTIVPIVLYAVKDGSVDMSPFVRRIAAFSAMKLYELDVGQKPELVVVIERLLGDRSSFVVGPAVNAFVTICPERIDLIHNVYEKLCAIIADIDEWSQVVITDLLSRFVTTDVSVDHRTLLRATRPLLQSRNSAVVMSVAQLYYHTVPDEFATVPKALIRLLRSRNEIRVIVLDVILSIVRKNSRLFQPYVKNFFVLRNDPVRIKSLKLEILTAFDDVSMILQELSTYLRSTDRNFVASTVRAIGKCGCASPDVSETCTNGLLSLMSTADEMVLAESVIVIKDLMRMRETSPYRIVKKLVRLFNDIDDPKARSTIVWLLTEYHDDVTSLSPDVLRKIARNFAEEPTEVKLQALSLAMRLFLDDPRVRSLCEYVFNMARYDMSYDVRDKARLLRRFREDKPGVLRENRDGIFLVRKRFESFSAVVDKTHLQLGSLSHYLNATATGYRELPISAVRTVDPLSSEESRKFDLLLDFDESPPATPAIIPVKNYADENHPIIDPN